MGPSDYELEAWEAVQRFKGRTLSQGMRWVGDKAADGFAALGNNADKFLESHPRAELAVSRGKGAFAGDAAIVLGLSSRVVGQVALNYGYDPEDPAEKLFILSVVNAGTAMSATAKTAAMADAYRRRLLIEKYPQLQTEESSAWFSDIEGDVTEDADQAISVIDEVADADGPDLREPQVFFPPTSAP